jgi:hypothetical protein
MLFSLFWTGSGLTNDRLKKRSAPRRKSYKQRQPTQAKELDINDQQELVERKLQMGSGGNPK